MNPEIATLWCWLRLFTVATFWPSAARTSSPGSANGARRLPRETGAVRAVDLN